MEPQNTYLLRRFSARYLTALRRHLAAAGSVDGLGARRIGREAVAAGLAIPDIAAMHERAMIALVPAYDFGHPRNRALRRAGHFFTQAMVPMEKARRSIAAANRRLRQRNATLHRLTVALTRGNRRNQREILRRQRGEAALEKGREEYRTLFLQSQVMQRKLRELTRRILYAQEEERKIISRELHDEVVQTLVGIDVELATLGTGATLSLHTLKAKISRTRRLVEKSVREVHRFARELRPAVLDDLGLIPALHAYSQSLAERRKFSIRITAFRGVEELESAKRTVLFRVAQEALTNVARHADATQVRVTIAEVSGAIRMEIGDNGKSFDGAQLVLRKKRGRLGLIGMRERVEMVGGTFTFTPSPGNGTTVCAEIPFARAKPKE